jgi:hypothetical protein
MGMRKGGEAVEEEKSGLLRGLTEQTVEMMEQILKDRKQFRRHFVKVKGEEVDQEERVYKKVDTKALKEFISALRELKELIGEEQGSSGIRVVFEAGDAAFNE